MLTWVTVTTFPKASYCNVTNLQNNTLQAVSQTDDTTNSNTLMCKEKQLWYAEKEETTESLLSYGFVLPVELYDTKQAAR